MDPLHGNPEQDLDDLTAQLEHALAAGGNGQQDYDLGDDWAPDLSPGLDRYAHMLADEHDDGLGGPLGMQPITLDDHPSLSYGQLVTPYTHDHPPAPLPQDHSPLAAEPAGDLMQADMQAGGPMQAGPHLNGGTSEAPSALTTQASGQARLKAGGAPATVRPTRAQPFVVTVNDPVKREATGLFGIKGGHVTYLVTTQVVNPNPFNEPFTRGATFSSRRRFRDFVALADSLKIRLRGHFLPPRPEKNAVEGQRMADGFVEDRRLALERYLNRLAQHPVASKCEELRVFLEAEGELETAGAWMAVLPAPPAGLVEGTARLSKQLLGLERSVLDPVQAVQPTKGVSDPMRAMKETAQAMGGGGGLTANSSGGIPPPVPAGEVELRGERVRLEGLRDALALASRAAEKLVHRMDRVAAVQGDTGLSIFKLCKLEEGEGTHLAQSTGTVRQSHSLAVGSRAAAAALVRASRLQRRAVGRAAGELSVLHDHLASLPAAIKGLSTREKQLLTHDTLAADLEVRQRNVQELETAGARVLGGDAVRARKVEELKGDCAKLECSISAARAEYERIATVNHQELARTSGELSSDLLRLGAALAAGQAASATRTAEVWLQLAGELGVPPQLLSGVRTKLQASQQQQDPSTDMTRHADGAAGSSSAAQGPPLPPVLAVPEGAIRRVQYSEPGNEEGSSGAGGGAGPAGVQAGPTIYGRMQPGGSREVDLLG